MSGVVVESEKLPSLAKRNDSAGISQCLEHDTPSLLEQRDAMLIAAKFGHIEAVTCLVSFGISVNISSDKGTTPLMQAAHRGHQDCCQLLLNSGANVDEQNEKLKTSLMLAVLGGHVSIVKVLLEHGHANTEIKEASGRTSLYLAASIGKLDIVDLLLKYGADRNAETTSKLTPLMAAARGGYDDICRTILENHDYPRRNNDNVDGEFDNRYIKDIDLQDQYGRTALIIAASVGKTDTCRLLVHHGADINSQSDNGTTALMAAIDSKADIECIEFLIEEETAIVTLCNIQGASALSYAAKRGYHNICKRLLDKGVDVESANERGTTALMVAANNGHLSVCKLLLEHGADPLVRNADRATAVDCAATSVVGACLVSWIEDLNDNGEDNTLVESKFSCEGKDDVGSESTDEMYESGDEPCNGKNPDDPESPNSARAENMVSQATANSNVNSVSGGEVDGLVSNEDDGKDDINSKLDEFYAICERSNGPPQRPGHNEQIKKQSDVKKFKSKELQAFICPITQEIMTDPCTCMDGHTYERRAIERWLEDHDTSPLTGAKLPSKMLLTNYALRNAIEESSEILKK